MLLRPNDMSFAAWKLLAMATGKCSSREHLGNRNLKDTQLALP